MKTEFQKNVTKETLVAICKMFHPDLTNEHLSKLSFSYKYTWVCIGFSAKQYGYVSIGVDNHSGSKLYGPNVTLKEMESAIKSGDIKSTAWRFDDDCKSERGKSDHRDLEYSLVPKPSPHEYYKFYYED